MTGPHAMNYLHVRMGDFHYEGFGLSHSKRKRLNTTDQRQVPRHVLVNLALLHEDADRRYSLDAWFVTKT